MKVLNQLLFFKVWNNKRLLHYFVFSLLAPLQSNAQASFAGLEHLFTTPKNYTASYTKQAPLIDGDIKEAVWQGAPWLDAFTDIEGEKRKKPTYATKVKMLWNDSCLFVAAELQEPHVWATLKQHDDIVYYDNDFEIFIDPTNSTHQYFEIEVNALNTIMDLLMPKPYRNGAAAMLSFDMCQLQSAVKVQGTLNNASDRDTSWTIEMAIPFKALYAGNKWKAPGDGALWRINFSRVQWEVEIKDGQYVKKRDGAGKVSPENNWVWSPQGVINMHYPERWGYLQFSKRASSLNTAFTLPYNEMRKQHLWIVYYRQKEFIRKHGKYAATLKELGITNGDVPVEEKRNKLTLEATSRQFSIAISDGSSTVLLNDEGLVQTLNKVL